LYATATSGGKTELVAFGSTGFQPVCLPGLPWVRGCPCPSPDAHYGLPGLRSLDAALTSPSWLRSASNAGSRARAAPRCIIRR